MRIVQLRLFGGEDVAVVQPRRRRRQALPKPRVELDPSPRLFDARRLEPGEPYRCLDCGHLDPDGTYGPPGSDVMILRDGEEWPVHLPDTWFCRNHSVDRWQRYVDTRAQVPKRRRRLQVFRAVEAEGIRGDERFVIAEAKLKEEP